jgi:hypothetical protein
LLDIVKKGYAPGAGPPVRRCRRILQRVSAWRCLATRARQPQARRGSISMQTGLSRRCSARDEQKTKPWRKPGGVVLQRVGIANESDQAT